MVSSFRNEILDENRFVVTLELVPGSESTGRSVDKVMALARDAISDGRISAVSITDNPGGNPRLSPDVLGKEILEQGMDVIVHMTCRDVNRVGLESRALQLAHMGMKNVLALSGDFSGPGFGGQGAPVFDLDSVSLICLLNMLGERINDTKKSQDFLVGCAVSPFKSEAAETFTQYYKLCRKASAGARFAITQLGYDARKFHELLQIQKDFGLKIPTLGSVYHLTPKSARVMCGGKVPGAVVTRKLLDVIETEWQDPEGGRTAAIERSARLAAVLKGLGYGGIHIGGILSRFDPVAAILDRMQEIENQWEAFIPEFDFPQTNGFYVYEKDAQTGLSAKTPRAQTSRATAIDTARFRFLRKLHKLFFSFDIPLQSYIKRFCGRLDKRPASQLLLKLTEDPFKKVLLGCQRCGDCAIEHVAFLCPESQCPKRIRNGACGGSREGMCEVYPERVCVWVRAYKRLAAVDDTGQIAKGCVPPRMWELNHTSSWLNFHLGRDHQSTACGIARHCGRSVFTTDLKPAEKTE